MTIAQPSPLRPRSGEVTIRNPDFEFLYKAGSTTVTAPALLSAESVTGVSSLAMGGPTVTFSDASTCNSFGLDGWTFTTQMVITNEDRNFGSTQANVVWFNRANFGGGTDAKSMSQVLAESLEQKKTYTLTADFGWRNDNDQASIPPVLNLYAGDTLLVPTESLSPDLEQGSFVTYSRTYLVDDGAISGALKVEVGLGANSDGRQLNADHVTLSKQ